jgi:regulator of protease activity HflC (stomatin/prohibitin superfamily)
MAIDTETQLFWSIARWVITLVVILFVGGLAGCPQYHVYEQRLHGEAELARAHAARQVLVQQAQAEMDAAKLRAAAIAIVGQAAKDFPEYRQQEFIGAFAEAMHNGRINQIIYVPTEANIPILERRASGSEGVTKK